ncbi:AmmeMemoRadiSam system radical SAM enzyme [Candidatus Woesearchaeota archaeon]|nr:AmmeMemoRadiSam system radical SAM enzyme [Candidatus Woesearchaeota archaeon]
MKEARWWKKTKENTVQCFLCQRNCVIPEGKTGFCGVRQNKQGKLYSLVYGKATGVQIDPIEKKPLYHFLPGSAAFSIGTAGCNFVCQHCQNWQTSQLKPEKFHAYEITPEEIVQKAKEEHCKSIAYTYNEPTIFGEYVIDTAKLARKKGLKNILITNGFTGDEARLEFCKYIDGVNIDLKAFDNEFYKKYAGAWIEPVLESLKTYKKKKVWLEATNLIIPTLNDKMEKIKEMINWLKENLGGDVPLHFSAFYPSYKLQDLPPTSAATLIEARKLAIEIGMKYAYIGNVVTTDEDNTYCPKCRELVIERMNYTILQNKLKNGKCKCGEKIQGVW